MKQIVPPVPRQGGARPNAGRKRGLAAATFAEYTAARARLEAARADLAELDFKIQSGDYVRRDMVRQTAATAFATVAQTMRSIPDNLERTRGLDGELAARIGEVIDATLGDLSEKLREIGAQAD
jgi:hypothetical protein